jgi:hypothetical protein
MWRILNKMNFSIEVLESFYASGEKPTFPEHWQEVLIIYFDPGHI